MMSTAFDCRVAGLGSGASVRMKRTSGVSTVTAKTVLLAILFLAPSTHAATILVTAPDDLVADDGQCTFREAIEAAEFDTSSGALPGECVAGSGADVIVFDLLPGTAIPMITSASYEITEGLTIYGPGADDLFIDGNGLERVFRVGDGAAPGTVFEFSGFTLRDGVARWLGGSLTEGYGGGMYHLGGELVLRDMVFLSNVAHVAGGALVANAALPILIERCSFLENGTTSDAPQVATGGGAIAVFGGVVDGTIVTIRDSLFARNYAVGSGAGFVDEGGGALRISSSVANLVVQIERSTFSSNTAAGQGGAIFIYGTLIPSFVTLNLIDSTVTANTADTDADSTAYASGGGIAENGNLEPVTITNSIIAGNFDLSLFADPAPDLLLDTSAVSGGTNVVGVDEGAATTFPAGDPNLNGDQVGTAAAPLNPHLDPLADNGGPTESHMPELVGATPLVDQGNCPGALRDQRDFANLVTGLRPVDVPMAPDTSDGCDIGAVEVNAGGPVTIFADGFESGGSYAWN